MKLVKMTVPSDHENLKLLKMTVSIGHENPLKNPTINAGTFCDTINGSDFPFRPHVNCMVSFAQPTSLMSRPLMRHLRRSMRLRRRPVIIASDYEL